VRRLVQERAQHADRAVAQALAADEQLGQDAVGVLPPRVGEVAELQLAGRLADRPGAERDHHRRDVGMPGPDRRPRRAERGGQAGGEGSAGLIQAPTLPILTRTCQYLWRAPLRGSGPGPRRRDTRGK